MKRLKSYGNISFEYNEFCQRTKKINGTSVTEYVYDVNSLIRMIDPSGNIYDFIYDENRYLEGFIYNFSNVYYYERDITGNIEKIIDNNGSTVVQYKYGACGKVLENTISSGAPQCNPYLYKGYCYDEETGLFMMGHRYYSPELCRFIQPDDIEYLDPENINGLNLYCYCFNNPVM